MSVLTWLRKRRLNKLNMAVEIQKKKVELLAKAAVEYCNSYYTDQHIDACTQLVTLMAKSVRLSLKG